LESGYLSFTDVTSNSGLETKGYSMGAAVGDINNDGFIDLYLTNYGKNQMFLNQGNGKFLEVSKSSGTDLYEWSISASFLDYDRDGDLDLYVTNYLEYTLETNKKCVNESGEAEYCGPASYIAAKDNLLQNTGDGTFIDISLTAKINIKGAGLGVVTADFNNDGHIDIYVTNDMSHNFMWINQKDGTFENESLLRGSAVNLHGKPEASMGVDAGDIDNDGDIDLFMTHLLNETNTIYLNNSKGFYKDQSSKLGLGNPSLGYTGFGTAFLDFNNDGWLDIISVNGEVRQIQEQILAGVELPLEQSNQLFQNIGGQFTEVSSKAPVLSIKNVSRGVAIGDIDNDGDTDVLITNNNSKVQLLENKVGNKLNWIGFSLVNQISKEMLGSTITVHLDNRETRFRRSRTDASYISANDPRILLGLGEYNDLVNVEVLWSDGSNSIFNNLKPNEYHKLIYLND
jgi:hypothetical protein